MQSVNDYTANWFDKHHLGFLDTFSYHQQKYRTQRYHVVPVGTNKFFVSKFYELTVGILIL